MSLESALIAIGIAVAKGVIKSRMAGNDVADETTDAVLDLLKDDASARFSSGSWRFNADLAHAAYRYGYDLDNRSNDIGFRVASPV